MDDTDQWTSREGHPAWSSWAPNVSQIFSCVHIRTIAHASEPPFLSHHKARIRNAVLSGTEQQLIKVFN